MQREGIFREMKLRGHYEKALGTKAREKAEAIRRARKLARKRLQREGLLPMKPKPVTAAAGGGRSGRLARLASAEAFINAAAAQGQQQWPPMAKRCPSLNLLVLGLLALGLLALTACSGLSNIGAPDNEAPIAPSQSNLASLTEVIQKHPDDPQAYNMRGSVLADTGNADAALLISTR